MTDFQDRVATLTRRSKIAEQQALTEEATKTSVILPFLQILGFDVFNLDEVIPEFISDVGTKKGEKVDFAVKIGGKISMLIEAKPITTTLGSTQYNQLFRYFAVTDARLGILINGREAWFFSDTDAPNKMDKKPFFKFDFQSHDKSQIRELERFHKDSFEIDSIIEAASNLKYARAAANYLKAQLEEPDDEFVKLVGKKIYDGSITKSVSEMLRPSIQAALDEIIRDRIQDKLSITFNSETQKTATTEPLAEVDNSNGIVTTEEELEAYRIVRAIGAKITDVERIKMRDAKSYCAVLMDDNNRRPVCRFYFNSAKTKAIGIFDAEKNETKHRIEVLSDIYKHIEGLELSILAYKDDNK